MSEQMRDIIWMFDSIIDQVGKFLHHIDQLLASLIEIEKVHFLIEREVIEIELSSEVMIIEGTWCYAKLLNLIICIAILVEWAWSFKKMYHFLYFYDYVHAQILIFP